MDLEEELGLNNKHPILKKKLNLGHLTREAFGFLLTTSREENL